MEEVLFLVGSIERLFTNSLLISGIGRVLTNSLLGGSILGRWFTKARAPFMLSHYIDVTVAFESLHGLIEKINAMVTHTQLQKRSQITALVLIRFINVTQPQR